jgi:chromosome segregation ATPase
MVGEQSEAFPEELREWVQEKASALDSTPDEVLVRAVTVYRFLDAESDVDLETTVADVDDRLSALDDRLETLEADFDENLQDVRERVIQVKRETDAKAPQDHTHPELRERVTRAVEATDEAASAVDHLEDRLDRGFDNYEEVLDYLTETTDELDEKLNALAAAVVDVRNATAAMEADERERGAVADLKRDAHRHGETTAGCDDCGQTIRLGLLARPRCPFCEARFVDLEPGRGFFSAATLLTGDRPALEGETDAPETPAELFEEETDE